MTTSAAARSSRLDTETVLRAAEDLIDTDGLDAVTMTRLATSLQTKASSLYNHVSSLDHLRAEIQVRTMRLLSEHISHAAMGQAGEAGLIHLASAFLDFVSTHPHRYAAMTRPITDHAAFLEASRGAAEALAAMISSMGIDDPTGEASIAFFASLHGYATLESGGFLAPTAGYDYDFGAARTRVVRGAISQLELGGESIS